MGQPPAPLLLGRHPGLRHLLLHHRLPLLPLQPPRLPHPVRALRCARHLSPPHALAHRARRPPALLRHLLPPSCLRPLPSCPACTSCMFEASPWEILLAGVSVSLGPTQLGTKM